MIDRSILVTGATGTFGRAFLQSCFDKGWRRVVGLSRDEVKQAALGAEFEAYPALRLFLGDVRDLDRLRTALHGVDTVVHAAALKRVDAGAYSPSELVATNILGTMNVVNASIQAGVKRVIVLSSDKSVNATNLYGATKFCAENFAVSANAYGRGVTKIAAVRYGNILGSRGSVVHIWRDQLLAGKPITITDEAMTRFVMTIEQAVQLVWFAAEHMHGGEVFVPALSAATMPDLAEAVVCHYPCTFPLLAPVVTGLRPGGEKLAESLLNEEEPARTYLTVDALGHGYYVVVPSHHEWTTGERWVQDAGDRWLSPDFRYRSDDTEKLTVARLRALLEGTVTCK